MKSKPYIIPVIAAITCMAGCSSNYQAMDVRQLSHEMQDSHFGLKDVQFDAIVASINGDGIMLSSMDGQVTTAGRVQRRIRSTVDTLRTGDKVHAVGHIEHRGEHGWVKNQLVIESIAKIGG